MPKTPIETTPAALVLRPAALRPWLAAAWGVPMACTLLAYAAGGGQPQPWAANWFNLLADRSLPRVLAAALLLALMGLAALAAWRAPAGRRARLGALAALALLLAFEQIMVGHWALERNLAALGGWARLVSLLPLAGVVVAAGVLAWPVLPRASRRWAAVCGAGYLAGTLGALGLSGLAAAAGAVPAVTAGLLLAGLALELASLSLLLLKLLDTAALANAGVTVRVVAAGPARVLAAHVSLLVVLAAASVLAQLAAGQAWGPLPRGLVQRFSLDSEIGFNTALNGFTLILLALLLAGVAALKWAARDPWRLLWGLLALAFAYLALDELAILHEHLGTFVAYDGLAGPVSYRWVLPALPIVLVFGLLYGRFLLHLPRRIGWLFVAAGALYVGGALGLEVVGALTIDRWGSASLAYLAAQTVEELCEGLGLALLLLALLDYIGASWGAVRLNLAAPAPVPLTAVSPVLAAAKQQEPG